MSGFGIGWCQLIKIQIGKNNFKIWNTLINIHRMSEIKG